jgi:hypothetical protein
MATPSQAADTAGEIDVRSYQQFWETVAPEVLAEYEGKCVALRFSDQGWQIVDAAATLDELRTSLIDAGHDLSQVVFDQIHTEDVTAPGIELQ